MRSVFSFRVLASLGVALLAVAVVAPTPTESQSLTIVDAPTGFTLTSNGFAEEFCAGTNQAALTDSPNSPQIPAGQCNFNAGVAQFIEVDGEDEGLGPIFNAEACGSCHLTPMVGGSSQIVEKRAGFFDGTAFFDPRGGSLIQDRATDISIQELSAASNNVTALRGSLSILGDGFVEAIGNSTLQSIANAQPLGMRGQLINVAVFEKPGTSRVGRFGWKDQQASLTSFSADAYVNEMGITSPLQTVENTSNGNSVAAFDTVPAGHPDDPDTDGVDVELFALFMRSTLAPPRDPVRAATANAVAGSFIFNNIGCATCHTREIITVAPGTLINGGALRVARALGNKRIQPFGDFLMHDIGTGDGIVQNGGQSTRNKVRTVPLWGLRARGRLMHDSLSFNLTDAIQRHGNQAAAARDGFNALTSTSRRQLLDFLLSL
jgi:CxxC motif-containing protein (DUF1111 family)